MNNTKSSSLSELTDRIRHIRDALSTGLVERDTAVRLALIAVCAGEHLLLLGPPGTAKSLIARRLRLAFSEATYFERLLTRFSVPEELFGPLSITGLNEDRYERLTEAYLPKASFAFLDEIFKANSAILNALLTLLNEREFDNGAKREATPLLAVIGASNELPQGDELGALYDRFLLRLHVGPVSAKGFRGLLQLRGASEPDLSGVTLLTSADVLQIQRAAQKAEVPADVEELLCELRTWCQAEGLEVSDRRWRKVVKLLQVSALTNGRAEVSIWDCWLLQHCVWSDPAQREAVATWYEDRVGTSAAMDPARLTKMVVVWEAQLTRDQGAQQVETDQDGRPLYVGEDGMRTTNAGGRRQVVRGADPLYLAPTESQVVRSSRDRTNSGQGYTEAELNQLYGTFPNGGYGHQQYFQNWNGAAAYLHDQSNWLMEDSTRAAAIEPKRHPAVYVEDCLGQVRGIQEDVDTYGAQLDRHVADLEESIRSHLWVTQDFVEPATASLDGTIANVRALTSRIGQVIRGYERLPREHLSQFPEGWKVQNKRKKR